MYADRLSAARDGLCPNPGGADPSGGSNGRTECGTDRDRTADGDPLARTHAGALPHTHE